VALILFNLLSQISQLFLTSAHRASTSAR